MKKIILTLTTILIALVFNACSSSDSFRGSKWGSTVDDVVKQEKYLDNIEYEKSVENNERQGEVTVLDYENIIEFDQDVFFISYEFKKNLNGKVYTEPVLFEATYYFEDNSFDNEIFLNNIEAKYGEGKKVSNALGIPVIEWNVGDSRIVYFPDSATLNYEHISESF
ncbi:hypothetical protein [Sporosarcina ureae]|uniref:hypothetical protein n=1 Tax=Sporosarcina ureae TaxID=1571 RepID=UPI000A17D7B9|nr:hypothetical protein [Sporosarcina ureae]ARK21875.1 hypothetical protein SporoP32a_10270 [Sporosarcina ureae]